MESTDIQAVDRRPPGSAQPVQTGILLSLLLLSVFAAAISRQSVAVLVAPMKAAFGMNDTQIGFYQGAAFFIPAAITAFPMGMLIDRVNLVRLMAALMAVVGLASLASGLCHEVWQLYFFRMCAGVAQGALMTAVYPLASDLYGGRGRSFAILSVLVALNLGNGAAFTTAGAIVQFATEHAGYFRLAGHLLAPWQSTFVLCAVPVLGLAALLPFCRTPKFHHLAEPLLCRGEDRSMARFVKNNFLTICFLLGGLLGAENAIEMTLVWAEAILGRRFGWSIGQAAGSLGITVSIGSLLGLALASALVAVLRPRLKEFTSHQIAKYALFASVIMFAALFAVSSGQAFVLAIGLLLLVNYIGIGVTPDLLLSFPPRELRGRFSSIYTIVRTIGGAASPIAVGAMSDALSSERAGLALSFSTVGVISAAISAVLFAAYFARVQKQAARQAPG